MQRARYMLHSKRPRRVDAVAVQGLALEVAHEGGLVPTSRRMETKENIIRINENKEWNVAGPSCVREACPTLGPQCSIQWLARSCGRPSRRTRPRAHRPCRTRRRRARRQTAFTLLGPRRCLGDWQAKLTNQHKSIRCPRCLQYPLLLVS